MSTIKRLVLVLALATSLTLLVAGTALAAGSIIPHGGYDASTDACLQCHDIHEAGSDYVLLRWATVLDTCGSCHFLYLGSPDTVFGSNGSFPNQSGGSFGQGDYLPSGDTPMPGLIPAYDPGYDINSLGGPVVETRTVLPTTNQIGSRTSAYEVDASQRDSHQGHRLQMGQAANGGSGGAFEFADGETDVADYIPGGTTRLTAIKQAAYDEMVGALSYSGTNGLYCASCHTPHGNFGQQLLKTGTTDTPIKGKLLSGKPNHTTPLLSIGVWASEGQLWCERCHDKRSSDPLSTYHNHPDSFCLTCHANAAGGVSSDFPHTGENPNLLSRVPDELCLECHKKGLLP